MESDVPVCTTLSGLSLPEELKLCRVIIEQSPVILFRRNPAPDYKLVYVSENIARFGYSASELLSGEKTFADLIHPDDMARMNAEIRVFERAGQTDYEQTYRILTRSGEVRWVNDVTTTARDEAGNILFYQGIVADVTERMRAEEELRKSEEKFRRIIETAAEGFVLFDPELRIADVNAAFCRLTGRDRDELLGLTPVDLADPEHQGFLRANLHRLRELPVRIFESGYVRPDGTTVPVLVHANTLTDAGGAPLGHVAFVTDLTEQKRSLALAREVMQNLTPRGTHHFGELAVAGKSLPCEEIGGDLFDLVAPGEDRPLTLVVGDISGHGVDSALLMAMARALVRDRLARPGTPSAILAELNATLYPDFAATSRFLTMILAQLEPDGSVRLARAGHDPALVYDPVLRAFRELLPSGLPLGVVEKAFFGTKETVLAPGEVLAIGTDGIWEARSQDGEMYGKERFKACLAAALEAEPAAGPRKLINAVLDDLAAFSAGHKREDDVTLLVARRRRPEG